MNQRAKGWWCGSAGEQPEESQGAGWEGKGRVWMGRARSTAVAKEMGLSFRFIKEHCSVNTRSRARVGMSLYSRSKILVEVNGREWDWSVMQNDHRRWDEGNKEARNNQLATVVQWEGRCEAGRTVERIRKVDGCYSMANKWKKMIQTWDIGTQMVSLLSWTLDISMRTATGTSWILKTGSCYIHEGDKVSEKFTIRVNKIIQRSIKKLVESCSWEKKDKEYKSQSKPQVSNKTHPFQECKSGQKKWPQTLKFAKPFSHSFGYLNCQLLDF